MVYKTDPENEVWTEERCFITEILNETDVPGMSIAQARVEPGVTTELHRLSVDEVYYILSGVGIIEINERHRARISVGDAVRIQSGFSQKITNPSDQDLIFLCICHPRFEPEGYTSLE